VKEKVMPKVISATDAANKFVGLVEEAAQGRSLFVITRMGKAQAVVLGVERYREIMEELEITQEEKDSKVRAALKEARKDVELGRVMSEEEFDKEFGFNEETLKE